MSENKGHHASFREVKSLLEQKEFQIAVLKKAVRAGEECGESSMTLRDIAEKRKQERNSS
jgi:antitoxin ParD1/3/4